MLFTFLLDFVNTLPGYVLAAILWERIYLFHPEQLHIFPASVNVMILSYMEIVMFTIILYIKCWTPSKTSGGDRNKCNIYFAYAFK